MFNSKDPAYEDNYIKPELSRKLLNEFKDELDKNDFLRNQFRDKVISIVKNASTVSIKIKVKQMIF